jgi:hypothetical protein
VTWKEYPDLAHWYKSPGEIDDVIDFIQKKIGWNLADILLRAGLDIGKK